MGVISVEQLVIEMGALPRHNHLVGSFLISIGELFKQKKVYPLMENCMLCFGGNRWSEEPILIDVELIGNMILFRTEVINKLDFVQPDFLLFQKNQYVQNEITSKTAGVPDLIVEVWSESNSQLERDFKKKLYSSNPKCEHWYLEQNSNLVECWLGKTRLANQNLKNVLCTKNNLQFDLKHLALGQPSP